MVREGWETESTANDLNSSAKCASAGESWCRGLVWSKGAAEEGGGAPAPNEARGLSPGTGSFRELTDRDVSRRSCERIPRSLWQRQQVEQRTTVDRAGHSSASDRSTSVRPRATH